MKNRFDIILACILAMLLSSCTSGPDYASVKASGALMPSPGKGMVLIYRTPGFVSAAYKPYLYADGSELPARLARGGFYSLELTPGQHTLAYSKMRGEATAKTQEQALLGAHVQGGMVGLATGMPVDYGMLGMGRLMETTALNEDIIGRLKFGLNIQVQSGQTLYVYMGGAGGNLAVAETSEAEVDIMDCKWLNPK